MSEQAVIANLRRGRLGVFVNGSAIWTGRQSEWHAAQVVKSEPRREGGVMSDQEIPCKEEGCTNVKYFAGRCNPCQNAWERSAGVAPLANPYAGMSWVEECMAKQGSRVTR